MTALPRLPDQVIHADWSLHAAKRRLAVASLQPDGTYRLEMVPDEDTGDLLLTTIQDNTVIGQTLLVGFDFVIGLPLAYALQVGCKDFLDFLHLLELSEWYSFFEPAESPEQVSLIRPFYPARPGGSRQSHLLQALNIPNANALRRNCERRQVGRRAAAPLFWTMGAQQVGKAALDGWRTILMPALKCVDVRLWPFSGELRELLAKPGTVLCETYPAEYYAGLGIAFLQGGKRSQIARQRQAAALRTAAERLRVDIPPEAARQIETGFGDRPEGEDLFDAVVGLLGMLQVLRGERTDVAPSSPVVRRVEGWILGQSVGMNGEVE